MSEFSIYPAYAYFHKTRRLIIRWIRGKEKELLIWASIRYRDMYSMRIGFSITYDVWCSADQPQVKRHDPLLPCQRNFVLRILMCRSCTLLSKQPFPHSSSFVWVIKLLVTSINFTSFNIRIFPFYMVPPT